MPKFTVQRAVDATVYADTIVAVEAARIAIERESDFVWITLETFTYDSRAIYTLDKSGSPREETEVTR